MQKVLGYFAFSMHQDVHVDKSFFSRLLYFVTKAYREIAVIKQAMWLLQDYYTLTKAYRAVTKQKSVELQMYCQYVRMFYYMFF